MIHFRLPIERDTRVSACDGYWCQSNSDDWAEVTCPECLKIHTGEMVTPLLLGIRGTVPAFYGHARKEWSEKDRAMRYVRVVRES